MISKIISTFGIRIIIAAINLFIVVLLSQNIGATGKGEASLIITSIALINIICGFIGGPTLVYLVPRRDLFQLLIVSYSWSLIVCTASYLFLTTYNIIPAQFHLHIFFLALLTAFISTNLTTLLGMEKIKNRNLLSLLQSVLSLLILLLFFYLVNHEDVFAYIYSLYTAFSIVAILSFILLIPSIKKLKFTGFINLIISASRVGFYNQTGHVMQFLSLRLSYFILLKYAGEASVGIYSNAASLAESIWMVSNSMAMVQYARIANNQNISENQQLTLRLVKASTLFSIIGVLPLLLLPSQFYTWLFGDDFTGIKTVLYLLVPGILIYNLELIVSHYFSGIGKYHINTYGNLVGLVVTILLTLIFIPDYGIVEAAITATVSYTVTALFITRYFMAEARLGLADFIPSKNDFKFVKTQWKLMTDFLK